MLVVVIAIVVVGRSHTTSWASRVCAPLLSHKSPTCSISRRVEL